MNPADGFLSNVPVGCSCSDALATIQRSLDCIGLRALQTFDLQEARLRDAGCICPYHGRSACDCQLQVFMVYGEAIAPTPLMLHGHDGQTWISLVDDASHPADGLIIHAVEEAIQCLENGQGL